MGTKARNPIDSQTQMLYAQKILNGEMSNDEVSKKLNVPTPNVSRFCETYAKIEGIRKPRKTSWFGLLNKQAKHPPYARGGKKTSVAVKRGKEWSITVGDYRVTLSGINEPEAVLLEKI